MAKVGINGPRIKYYASSTEFMGPKERGFHTMAEAVSWARKAGKKGDTFNIGNQTTGEHKKTITVK